MNWKDSVRVVTWGDSGSAEYCKLIGTNNKQPFKVLTSMLLVEALNDQCCIKQLEGFLGLEDVMITLDQISR